MHFMGGKAFQGTFPTLKRIELALGHELASRPPFAVGPKSKCCD